MNYVKKGSCFNNVPEHEKLSRLNCAHDDAKSVYKDHIIVYHPLQILKISSSSSHIQHRLLLARSSEASTNISLGLGVHL